MPDPEIEASHLLPGEQVLWRSSAAWSRAARPPRRALQLLVMTAIAIVVSFGAALVVSLADSTAPQTFARSLAAIGLLFAGALTVYLWVRVAGRALALFERLPPRTDLTYALTDRRLLIVSADATLSRTVTSANYLLEATLKPNGRVHDLELWFGPRGNDDFFEHEDPIRLLAVENAAAAKREIFARFGPPVWDAASAPS